MLPTGMKLGRYRVVSLLGRGGMGAVYLAHDDDLGIEVALKVLHQAALVDADARQRFENEARVLKGLGWHPNIVPIRDYGTDPYSALPWLVMTLIAGNDLRAELDEQGRPLGDQRSVSIAEQVGRALDFAHEHDVVHRDVKPANILLVRQELGRESALLTDFGIAKDLSADGAASQQAVGTWEYAAPEQFEPNRSGSRSDVYALGAVIFEMLTGHRPFRGGFAEVYGQKYAVVPRAREHRVDLPKRVDEALATALAFDPADRFATCDELVREVAAGLRGGPAGDVPAVTVRKPPPVPAPRQVVSYLEPSPSRRNEGGDPDDVPEVQVEVRVPRGLTGPVRVVVTLVATLAVVGVLGIVWSVVRPQGGDNPSAERPPAATTFSTGTAAEASPTGAPSPGGSLDTGARGRTLTLSDFLDPGGQWQERRYDIADQKQVQGIGTSVTTCGDDNPARLDLRLGGNFNELVFAAGQADDSPDSDQTLDVQVIADDQQVEARSIPFNQLQQFTIDTDGVNTLEIELSLDDGPTGCAGAVIGVITGATLA